jgi:hypothetical protein
MQIADDPEGPANEGFLPDLHGDKGTVRRRTEDIPTCHRTRKPADRITSLTLDLQKFHDIVVSWISTTYTCRSTLYSEVSSPSLSQVLTFDIQTHTIGPAVSFADFSSVQ